MSRHAGFTLLETLIAMALTALVALALSSAISVARRSWDGIATAGDDAAPAALALARRQLTQALPLAPDRAGFAGGPDGVGFIAPSPSPALDGIVYRQRLERRGDDLWLTWQDLDGGLLHQRRLLAGAAPAFAYFGEAGWQNAWTDAAHPPRMVRLRVSSWPDVVAGPMVGWPILPPTVPK
jgi:prepilin-type N-terminal cleavage/methylation domain-containing protein